MSVSRCNPRLNKALPTLGFLSSATHSDTHSGVHYGSPTDIWIARSEDDGKSFSRPVQVNDDPPGAVHRFPFVGVDAQGGICVSWLDKRKKTSEGADLTRVFFARSTDGARTFGKNVDATSGQTYPICHCCRVATTNDPNQGLMIAFRNDINDLRDMFLVRSTDYGRTFSTPTPLEHTKWTISYCPMDGPSIGIAPNGYLHAVWMSGAKITGKPVFGNSGGDAKILYNRIAPGFSKAEEPVLLGEGHHPRLALGPSGEAYILWHRYSSILLARMGSGIHDVPQQIQIGDEKGVSSYPSLALSANGTVYCAWQESQPDDSVQIYLSCVPVSSFFGTREGSTRTKQKRSRL